MSDVRLVIVCMPADTCAGWFSASEILNRHRLATSIPVPMFPVRRRAISGVISRWSARHLVHPVRRRAAVALAAGGRLRRLDLTAAATLAHADAVYRWRVWSHVVARIPAARPPRDFRADHRLTAEQAVRQFEAQPRVLAMLAHNCHPHARVPLHLQELEAYQAGEITYSVLHWQRAIAGDAMVTDDGGLLEPASDSLADRLRYLAHAAAYLRALPQDRHIVAVHAAPRP
ncbi:hypothetical protein [Micromonospora coerulea]|uniref:hypothetical protein n=1 Tax=Micromonospora coerulea TaxID=47856 RepID=UPI001906C863|nr:hypothetical protein [Micromonospora veneta]